MTDFKNNTAGYETATFAGGCFWCIEAAFKKINGLIRVVSGYTGGHTENPSYEDVISGATGHFEAVRIIFNPDLITYSQLLDIFFRQIDPTDGSGSFMDRGPQYRPAVFYHNETQKLEAEAIIEQINQSGRFKDPLAVMILAFDHFYEAESYHQEYHKKKPIHYQSYRAGSGRDQFIRETWDNPDPDGFKKPAKETLRARLSPLQYHVTQENGTEQAFDNEYWDNERQGIYVDIVSKEPLFSSTDQFKSGCGWPSFTKPIDPMAVVEKKDHSLSMTRMEVRSRKTDSHLGHVFNDGPVPDGLRYCINSASLLFVPAKDLGKYGLQKYQPLFDETTD